MKKIVLVAFLLVSSLLSNEGVNPFLRNSHFPGSYFLIPDSLPHFMGLYMKHGGMHLINPTKDQEKLIEKQYNKMVPLIMKIAKEIKLIETNFALELVNTKKDDKSIEKTLNEVAKLKKELTLLQIEALQVFQNNLTKKQYKQMITLAIKEAGKK